MNWDGGSSAHGDVLSTLEDVVMSISCPMELEELETEYLRSIDPLIPAHATALYLFKPRRDQPERIAASGVDPGFISHYEKSGRALDPLRAWITAHRSASRSRDLLGLRGWQKHPVYRVVGAAQIDFAMQCPILLDADVIGTLNFGRRINEGDFTDSEIKVVSILSRFLSLAVSRAAGGRQRHASRKRFCKVMDEVQQGIAITDGDYRVCYVNGKGRGLAARAFGREQPAEQISSWIRDACRENGGAGTAKSGSLSARFCPVPGAVSKSTLVMLDDLPDPPEFSRLLGVLTAREIDVLQLVATGLHNGEVAARLGVSINTVKRHLDNIYCKANVRSRTELVSKAYRVLRGTEPR